MTHKIPTLIIVEGSPCEAIELAFPRKRDENGQEIDSEFWLSRPNPKPAASTDFTPR